MGVLLSARPFFHLAKIYRRESAFPPPSSWVSRPDDASGLNATPVAGILQVPADPAAAETFLRGALAEARSRGLPVTMAGARHTQGGHTLARDGYVLDMNGLNGLSLDSATGVLTAGAGARWADILPFLAARGRSVAVMQSDNIFTVGGSVSVNVHGWQNDHAPLGSTVLSLKIMTADGRVFRAGRRENPDLFSAAVGGYGLVGIILEADIQTVPDEGLRARRWTLPAGDFPSVYAREARGNPAAAMAYGRLSVAADHFLTEALLTVYEKSPATPSATGPDRAAGLKRLIFRGSVGSDYGKRLRWSLEKRFIPFFDRTLTRRSAVLNQTPADFLNRDPSRTDILHEYFVPLDGFGDFLADVRRLVPASGADLLNVTVRTVAEDKDSLLRYADRDMFAFVMLFNQEKTAAAEVAMGDLTRALIEAALSRGGRYYLPYRPHATRAQFRRAYPGVHVFRRVKKRYDPRGFFRNTFYENYVQEDADDVSVGRARRGI